MLPDKMMIEPNAAKPWNDPNWILIGIVVLFGFLVPLMGYAILPLFNVTFFAHLFSFHRLIKLVILIVGGIAYWGYLRFITQRPFWLLVFSLTLWPVVQYFNELLLIFKNINVHLRPLTMAGLSFPIMLMGFRYRHQLWEKVPYLKYYGLFILFLLGYFVLYNAKAADYSGLVHNVRTEANIGLRQMISYTQCFLAIILAGVCSIHYTDNQKRFDKLNIIILVVSSIISIVTIAGFPFHYFGTNLDGFYRAKGIFTHPNPYSHHMGMLLIYFLGLFCYYHGFQKNRIPAWLLNTGIFITLSAFLLGLSKTAIAASGISILVLALLNFASPNLRPVFIRISWCLLFAVPIGLWLFEAITGYSFFYILQNRIEQQQSLTWRTEVWQGLLSQIHFSNIWFGHGFTAANDRVLQLTYNVSRNAKPLMMVHNGYLSLIYDMGILGMTMFLSAVSLMIGTFQRYQAVWLKMERPLLATILAMGVYFLAVCAFDEMAYMFDAPILFWTLSTLLFTRVKPVGKGFMA